MCEPKEIESPSAMRDARQQYSEKGFHQSQSRKCRRSSVVRGIAAQQRHAEVRTARVAGVAVKEVAHAFRLSCRHVSRIAPLRCPRSLCGEAFSVGPRGQRGWLMSLYLITKSVRIRSRIRPRECRKAALAKPQSTEKMSVAAC